jgi:2,3-bisphosphoglycerate-dependent phosphoglycerate mutase
MATLVLLRHGESEWNRANLFTGWQDVGLTDTGEAEAAEAARMLADAGIDVDVVHTSVLVRAIRTAEITLAALGRSWVPVRRHWRLNERHYGALEGTNKRQATERWGEAQVHAWRRGYATPPPPLAPDDPRHPRFDPRYAALPPDVLPASECLADVVARMLPYWHDAIVPDLRAGMVVLVAAHGNSLRALVKHLDRIPDEEIPELNIPTGIPLVYELSDDDPCTPAAPGRYLADPDVVAAKVAAVARQATAGPGN